MSRTVRPTVHARWGCVERSAWDGSPGSPARARCARRGRRGASRLGRGNSCSPNLAAPARSRRDVGTGPVSSARWKWKTLTDVSPGQRYASFLVVHSSQLADQTAVAYVAAQAKEAERPATHVQNVEARWFACAADAEEAITDYEGRGQGRRGRKPHPWRYHALHYRVEAVRGPKKRTQRGRPPKAEAPQVEVRYHLAVHTEALVPTEGAHGWTVLATTLRPEVCTDA